MIDKDDVTKMAIKFEGMNIKNNTEVTFDINDFVKFMNSIGDVYLQLWGLKSEPKDNDE